MAKRKKEFEDMSEVERVQDDWTYLGRAPIQTEEMCMAAVWKDVKALELVKDQTEMVCRLAIKYNLAALKYVREQTKEICEFAIDSGNYSLKLVKDQTQDLCMRALRKSTGFPGNGDPSALEYIRKGSQTNALFRQMMEEGIKIRKEFVKADPKKLDPDVRLYIEI